MLPMPSSEFYQALSSGDLNAYFIPRTQQLAQHIQEHVWDYLETSVGNEQLNLMGQALKAYVLEVDQPMPFERFQTLNRQLSEQLFALSGGEEVVTGLFFNYLSEELTHNAQFLLYSLKHTLETLPDQNHSRWLGRSAILQRLNDYIPNGGYHEVLVQALHKNPEFLYEMYSRIAIVSDSLSVNPQYFNRVDLFGERWTAQDLAFLDQLDLDFTAAKAHPDPQIPTQAKIRESVFLGFTTHLNPDSFTDYLAARPQHPLLTTQNLIMARFMGRLFSSFSFTVTPPKIEETPQFASLIRLADVMVQADVPI